VAAQPSKWSQVYTALKLENGVSKYAPKIAAPVASDTVLVANTNDTLVVVK
jgi:hypothetical protein